MTDCDGIVWGSGGSTVTELGSPGLRLGRSRWRRWWEAGAVTDQQHDAEVAHTLDDAERAAVSAWDRLLPSVSGPLIGWLHLDGPLAVGGPPSSGPVRWSCDDCSGSGFGTGPVGALDGLQDHRRVCGG